MTKQDYENIAYLIDKNDWDDCQTVQRDIYRIEQIQGTAFDSDYKCYKVQVFPKNHLAPVMLSSNDIHTLVVKITHPREGYILQSLLNKHFSVPKIEIVFPYKNNQIMLFEQFIPGKELYSISDPDIWLKAALYLANLHSEFLCIDQKDSTHNINIGVSDAINQKIYRAKCNIHDHRTWVKYIISVEQRLAVAPKTLIHGDLFPTNILSDDELYFVDWADTSIYAYMMDIGRLTAIIDKKTLRSMCPCPEDVITKYYDYIKTALKIDYADYLNDVRMAQFIELANLYAPQGSFGSFGMNKEYNRVVENQINEIVAGYYKQN